MKLKQLAILTGILAIVIAAVMMNTGLKGDAQDDAIGKRIYAKVLPEEVSTIVLNGGKEEVTLEVKDGKWVVAGRDGFPANADNIAKLVSKAVLMEAADVKTDINDKYLSRFKLQKPGTGGKDDETGTSVVLKKADGTQLASFLIGKTASNSAGMGGYSNSQPQYLRDDAVAGKVFIIKEAYDYFMNSITNKDWLDKVNFMKVEKPKSVALTSAKPEDNWTIAREKEGTDVNELKLADAKPGEEFDVNKASNSANAFASASFTDVATAEQKAKAGLEAPARTAVIDTFDGFKYTIKVGNAVEKPAGADPAAGASDEYFVTFDVDATLNEKQPEPAPVADDKRTDEEKKKAAEDATKKFTDDLTKAKEKLAKEKALAGKVYILPKYSVDPLLKNRSELMKDKPADGAAPAAAATPPTFPGSSPAATPMPEGHGAAPTPVKHEPITATTPPISVDIPANNSEAKQTEAMKAANAKDQPKVEIKPAAPAAK